MSPFNFFKKKDKDISKIDNNIQNKPNTSHHSDNIITIDFALDEIKKKENNIIINHLDRLRKICEDIKQSFEIINSIAENIELEEIKEEERLTPLINNTRNIVVKSLKRESSNALQIPETFEESGKV